MADRLPGSQSHVGCLSVECPHSKIGTPYLALVEPRPYRDPITAKDPSGLLVHCCAIHFTEHPGETGRSSAHAQSNQFNLCSPEIAGLSSKTHNLFSTCPALSPMFSRSQPKQQGFAKEQRVADAQLESLRQLGLVSTTKKGPFASAWGGTDPLKSPPGRPPYNYTTSPGPFNSDIPTYPDNPKGV